MCTRVLRPMLMRCCAGGDSSGSATSASGDEPLEAWVLADSFDAHMFGVSSIVPFTPPSSTQRMLATLGRDGSLQLWNAPM